MAESEEGKVRQLDPVVVEALKGITQSVYHRRGPSWSDTFRRYYSMLDSHSRDRTIATFMHLKHGGYDFQPFLVRRWAVANGWKETDAQVLDDYAAGVLAGVRYHHGDPMGRQAVETWQASASGKPPWIDPGRPQQRNHFTRRD
jgi:hypothetical protein